MDINEIRKQVAGKFFSVTFVKKDGSTRVLSGRLGVHKHTKGGVCTVNTDEHLIVWSMADEGYRAVNVDRILSIQCGDFHGGA